VLVARDRKPEAATIQCNPALGLFRRCPFERHAPELLWRHRRKQLLGESRSAHGQLLWFAGGIVSIEIASLAAVGWQAQIVADRLRQAAIVAIRNVLPAQQQARPRDVLGQERVRPGAAIVEPPAATVQLKEKSAVAGLGKRENRQQRPLGGYIPFVAIGENDADLALLQTFTRERQPV